MCPEGLRLRRVLALAILEAASVERDVPPPERRTAEYLSALDRAQVKRKEALGALSRHVRLCPKCTRRR